MMAVSLHETGWRYAPAAMAGNAPIILNNNNHNRPYNSLFKSCLSNPVKAQMRGGA